MAKKKATMTLKDFHGGSIPSDLPLPSAPGVLTRPLDRPGFERQGSWGNPMGRSDHQLRPGSAGALRNFDDKTPFLSPGAHIGRNFDEDERKPLDGGSGPRRIVSDESIRALPIRTEVKPDYSFNGTLPGQRVLSPVSHLSSSSASSYVGRVTEATHVGVNSQPFGSNTYSVRFAETANVGMGSSNLGGNSVQAASGAYPNAWAMRKETVSITEPLTAMLSGSNAASKLAHASALDKVSSGRWQSKQPIHHPTDVEVIGHAAIEREFHSKDDSFYNKDSYNHLDMAGGVAYHETMLARHAQRSLTVGGNELPSYERAMSPLFPETKETNPPSYAGGVQPARNDGKFGGLKLQSLVPSEQFERPKLELHPRPKPLESLEPHVNYKKDQQPHNSNHLENDSESYGNADHAKSGLSATHSGNTAVERPKLHLKPRTQAIEQLEGNIERERNSLFGGARPRELVLKERGIDDVSINNHDMSLSPNRVKQDVTRTEAVPTHSTPTRYNEKMENTPLDNRVRKNYDRREKRVEVEKTDVQRSNWRSENRRNNREAEQHQHQHPHHQPRERPSLPETWRKPAEQPKPASADAPEQRYVKAASAVELAQAFSRSVSDPKTTDRLPGQRGVPSWVGQMPFSRLMDPTSRSRINGY
ncbi:Eukaryotic translation initiation factor 4H like [Actinidia chinensis var. chinensis]|uniref:Eukaryotic translation initiation factor 4H like n=1 Tax=Actinidia chinensis var. chinensis TaxID=1590841 RepID=A0A2R6PXV1_ACTCC|nr:Eukaryotic translation initiation factor 4H like [Actinidia chinensis var. chinensis]